MKKKIVKKEDTHNCKLCEKSYKTERGLFNHKCKIKIRLEEKNEQYARFGFNAYVQFYKKIQPRTTEKSYLEFARSSYYNGFIEYGKYIKNLKIPHANEYTNFLITYNIKLTDWCNDRLYDMYVKNKAKKESPERAVELSINTMLKWSKRNNARWQDYFTHEEKYKIIQSVRTGRLSPWVIFNTDTGKIFLSKLDDQELNTVYDFVEPEFWTLKFKREAKHADAVYKTLKEAGL